MAKGKHRESKRIVLPNGMWVLMYADGSIKIAGYDRALTVTEVQTRAGGSHVFIGVKELVDAPREPAARGADLLTVQRSVKDALAGLSQIPVATGSEDDSDPDELATTENRSEPRTEGPTEPGCARCWSASLRAAVVGPLPAGALSVARARLCVPPARSAPPGASPACGGYCVARRGPSFGLPSGGARTTGTR